ncbi:hypothetical protein SEA_OHFAH_91 [Mycobacterium phage Ohfah]|uniref:Uncharacterized protein n=10 Tax=Backyardiganvirus TaxID=2946815 RepID=A0A411BPW0_9CAUD|nr:hypothetical protein KIY69_gp92 [Mycobacterium phage Cerulean]ALF01149.1 hypothetical protein SEA_MAVERICK_91 [Mycobacterium phage Maverick]AQP31083.1 hypothetical protein SEA_TINYBOT_89 [Mycobacterium phage Tinybot]AXF51807.1 hypothetical protein SEA_HOUDINI22_89 [Mycobacterium phage Houdini22]AXF51885.1 hypothetical protein SEA_NOTAPHASEMOM_89 [Mycobacterium phage NotAPhaseMom]AXQ52862.1 hypothetical protein SEA_JAYKAYELOWELL_86 [Mycobacterium phage Jaykayelowell]AXQ63182.1 hypothetical 
MTSLTASCSVVLDNSTADIANRFGNPHASGFETAQRTGTLRTSRINPALDIAQSIS